MSISYLGNPNDNDLYCGSIQFDVSGSALSEYKEDTVTINWQGAFTETSQCKVIRVGNVVNFNFNYNVALTVTDANFLYALAALPQDYLPSNVVYGTFLANVNGNLTNMSLQVSALGGLVVYKNLVTPFSNGDTLEFLQSGISWNK